MGKIYEISSSFHVKQRNTGKTLSFIFQQTLLVLKKFRV